MKTLLTIISFIILFAASAQKKNSIDLKKLDGNWISADDKRYHINIKGSAWIDYYGKEKNFSLAFTITKNIITATDNSTKEIYRYEIAKLNDKILDLVYLDRGNKISFKRKL